jgi:hypothetical protein
VGITPECKLQRLWVVNSYIIEISISYSNVERGVTCSCI